MSIRRFPTSCFVLISLLIAFSACAPAIRKIPVNTDKKLISVIPFSGDSAVRMKAVITFEKAELSGIMLVKLKGDTVTGAFINEFGLKGFEFTVCKGRCKLMHVMSLLDKWYIKRTLSEDLSFIFTVLYHDDKSEVEIKTYKNQEYTYFFQQKAGLKKIERYKKGVFTASLVLDNDSAFTMTNTTRNIIYRMNTLTNK